MAKPKVYITRMIDPSAIEKIRKVASVQIWEEDKPIPYDLLTEKIKSVDGLLTLLTDKVDHALIDARGKNLKVISQMAVGYDNIDVNAATAAGLPVGHTPGVLTETCADFAMALLLTTARRIIEAHNQVKNGIWLPWGPDVMKGQEVNGSTLGIIGFGRIGQAVARRAKGFGMKLVYNDTLPNPAAEAETGAVFASLEELLETSDFVTTHTILSSQTRHLINEKTLKLMKPNAILINTSRGGVVDGMALYQALKSHQIQAAALDVFDPEPIPTDHPILTLDNIVITPHIASASTRTRQLMATLAANNLIAGLAGERLPHCANPEVYKA